MKLATLGLVIGLAGAFALARSLTSLLYGVTPADPVTFVIATLVLPTAAFAACWLPARRAAGHSPVTALRIE
jgi:ABC-type lipoprotein release transport system permease subunit